MSQETREAALGRAEGFFWSPVGWAFVKKAGPTDRPFPRMVAGTGFEPVTFRL
jgi:hypothetical protein